MTLDKLIEDKSKQKRVTEDDTFAFVESKRNENTKKKTNSDVNRFKEWLCQDGQNSNFEEMPAKELDMCISRYFLTVKNQKTNKDLEPGTLKGIQGSIRRYLMQNNYKSDIMTHSDFKHSREVLTGLIHLPQKK